MRRTRLLSALLLAAWGTTPLLAAEGDSTATLTILADADSILVAIDGSIAGRTPLTIDHLPPGRHPVALYGNDLESWFAPCVRETVEVGAGEHRTLRFPLRRRLHLLTDPPGADVFIDDSLAGTTPIVLQRPSDSPSLSLRKPGYLPGEGPEGWRTAEGALTVALLNDPSALPGEGEEVIASRAERAGRTRLFVAGGAAVVSGVIAGYCKIEADKHAEAYAVSANPAFLNERRRLDTVAAVALVVTQISLGLFTWFAVNE